MMPAPMKPDGPYSAGPNWLADGACPRWSTGLGSLVPPAPTFAKSDKLLCLRKLSMDAYETLRSLSYMVSLRVAVVGSRVVT